MNNWKRMIRFATDNAAGWDCGVLPHNLTVSFSRTQSMLNFMATQSAHWSVLTGPIPSVRPHLRQHP